MQAPWECVKHKWPYKAGYNENSVPEYVCERYVRGIERQEGIQHFVPLVNFGLI